MANDGKAQILSALAQAYGPMGWQGPTIQRVLRGVNARAAWARPIRRRHTIWELTLHMAYWTHAAHDRITGRRTAFPRSPRNFPRQPARPDAKAWRADVKLLADQHAALVRLVKSLSPRQLGRRVSRRWTAAETALGVALHDMYHAGQIGLLRKALGK